MTNFEIINLPIPKRVNNNVLNYLGTKKWSFVNDRDEDEKNLISTIVRDNSKKDAGQAIITYNKLHPNPEVDQDNILNFFGDLIFSLIQENTKLKVKEVSRVYWNLYSKSSACLYHQDDKSVDKYMSAVYNLHTNDGGTMIEDKFIPAVESQAILFKSEIMHKDMPPKSDNLRLSLNIVMELE